MVTDGFDGLDVQAARRVTVALTRIRLGNLGVTWGVGGGVSECKIDFGPGYRVYFGLDVEALVILLCGGSKKGQSDDITAAKLYWADYKKRKRLARARDDGTDS